MVNVKINFLIAIYNTNQIPYNSNYDGSIFCNIINNNNYSFTLIHLLLASWGKDRRVL